MAAKNKLAAEAALEEEKMILGWHWDLRRLIISLPVNKFEAWTAAMIEKMISEGTVTTKELESTNG